jgi:hypothetical protein
MKKKIKRFVRNHEYFSAVVLSFIGALLTKVLVG